MRCASPKPFRWSKYLMSRAIVKLNKIFGAMVLLCFGQNILAVEEIRLELKNKALVSLGKDACESTENVKIILGQNIIKDHDDFRAYVKAGDKKDPKINTCPETISDSTSDVETFTKNSASVPLIFLMGGKKRSACNSEEGSAGVRLLCIYPETSGSTKLVGFAYFSYDTTQAKIEGIEGEIAANNEIAFEIKYDAGPSNRVKQAWICYGEYDKAKNIEDTSKGECPEGFTSEYHNLPNILLTGLKNKKEYQIKVKLVDPGDSSQTWFKPFKLTPEPIALALPNYNGHGGDLMYSCQTSSPSSSVVLFLAFIVLMALSRIRKKALKSSLLVLPFLCMLPAKNTRADFGQISFGILGSPYRPDLDSEKTSSGENIYPFYKNFFRKDTNQEQGRLNPLMGLEVNMHLWDGFGSLQAGLGMAYTYVPGMGLAVDDNDKPLPDKPQENYKLGLHIYRLSPQITYIFNPYVRYFPIAPYVRGALIVNGYSFQDRGHSAKTVTTPGDINVKAHGIRFGYEGAFGLMLNLNFLEPSSVRSARASGFFDSVYLKAELSYTKINSFGKPGFNFSPKDIMGTSLPLMWTFGLVFDLP